MEPTTAVAAEATTGAQPAASAAPAAAASAVPAAAASAAPAVAAPVATQAADAIDALDDSLDRAFDTAASGLWSLAARVKAAVPKDRDGLRGFEAAARGVVGTVQRRAAQVEEVLLDVALAGAGGEGEEEEEGRDTVGEEGDEECGKEGGKEGGETGGNRGLGADANAAAVMFAAAGDADLMAMGMVGGLSGGGGGKAGALPEDYVHEDLDVNKELARAAETLQASVGTLQARAGDLQATAGKTVGGLLGSLSLWAAGDGDGEDEDQDDRARDAPHTRFQALMRDLEMNPDTYCQPADDLDAFTEWGKRFDLDALEPECVDLLDRRPTVAELYERVVPRLIEEDTFWMRYFYARHALNKREQERLALLQRAVGAAAGGDDDDGGGWDDDDWDDDEEEEEVVAGAADSGRVSDTDAADSSAALSSLSPKEAASANADPSATGLGSKLTPGVVAATNTVEPVPKEATAEETKAEPASTKSRGEGIKKSPASSGDEPQASSVPRQGASDGKDSSDPSAARQVVDDERPPSDSAAIVSTDAAAVASGTEGPNIPSNAKETPPIENADEGSDSDDWE